MRDASKDFKEIIKLKKIYSLEKVQLHSFLSAVDAIRIHSTGKFIIIILKSSITVIHIKEIKNINFVVQNL